MSLKLSRRAILQALAGSAALAPLFNSKKVFADPPSQAPYIFLMTSGHGPTVASWEIPQTAQSDNSFGDINLNTLPQDKWSPVLAPLYPYRDGLLALDGLHLLTGWALQQERFADNAHSYLPISALTGRDMTRPINQATGISVDQYIAQQLVTKYGPRANLSLDLSLPNYGTLESFNAAGERIPAFEHQIFSQLFPSGFTPGKPIAANAQRAAIIDQFVNNEYSATRKITTENTQRLQAHAASLASLSARLKAGGMPNSASVCSNYAAMTPPSGIPAGDSDYEYYDTNAAMPVLANIIAAAFACDLTRVATLNAQQLTNTDFMNDLDPADGFTADQVPADVHQEIAHKADPGAGANFTPLAAASMKAFYKRYSIYFSTVIQALQAAQIPNFMCIWTTELGDGNHSPNQWRAVVYTSPDFKGVSRGWYRRYTPVDIQSGSINSSLHGTPLSVPAACHEASHSNLLVSLCNAAGLSDTTFGDPRFCFGPLTRFAST